MADEKVDSWKEISREFNHTIEAKGNMRRLVDENGNIIIEWTAK